MPIPHCHYRAKRYHHGPLLSFMGRTKLKPYGVPRTKDLIYPDVADIQHLGLASHCGRIPGRSGDFRPYIRSENKARTRRIWKRKARAAGRAAISEGMKEYGYEL